MIYKLCLPNNDSFSSSVHMHWSWDLNNAELYFVQDFSIPSHMHCLTITKHSVLSIAKLPTTKQVKPTTYGFPSIISWELSNANGRLLSAHHCALLGIPLVSLAISTRSKVDSPKMNSIIILKVSQDLSVRTSESHCRGGQVATKLQADT